MSEQKKYSKLLKLLIKILFSAAALYYVIYKNDFNEILNAIKGVNPLFLVLALLIYILSQVVSSFRLNSLFRALPLKLEHWANIKLYWLGMFYNFFLPGGVGGDGYKVYLLRKHFKVSVKKLLTAILADRLSGLSIILVYLLGLVYYIDYELPYQGWFFLLIPVVSAGYFVFLWIFNKSLTKAFWQVSVWSLVIQGLQMVAVICILEAMGASMAGKWDNYLFLFLLSSIAAAVPITLGGIGAREMTFAVGATYLGINEEYAIALSLMFYFLSLISSIPGIYYSIRTDAILDQSDSHSSPILEEDMKCGDRDEFVTTAVGDK
ncbi:UPF0104 family protein [Marinilabiliaceae bacterium JC017]|nr:UPF0104 family protein [Marinilabiliaceae bacterium JC017]